MKINEYWKKFPPLEPYWYFIVAILSLFITFFGFLSNILVLFYLIKKRFKKGYSGRLFIINLAICDLLNISINITAKTISNFNQKWIFGTLGCQLYGFLGGLFGFVSITTMALMTLERFIIVKNPLNALKIRKKIIMSCTLFSWVYSLIWISLEFLSKNGFELEGMLTSCTFDYLSRDLLSRSIIIAMVIGGFLIPTLIIFIFYFFLLSLLKYKNSELLKFNFESINRNNSSFAIRRSSKFSITNNLNDIKSVPNSTFSLNLTDKLLLNFKKISNDTNSNKENTYQNRSSDISFIKSYIDKRNYLIHREIRVAKTILICVSFFCFSWFPYSIMVLSAQFGRNIENYITPLSASLPALFAKMSTVINPIVYTLANKDCRTFLLKIFGIKTAKSFSFNSKIVLNKNSI